MSEPRRRRRPQMLEIERQRAQEEAQQVEIRPLAAHGAGAAERRRRHEARQRQIVRERVFFALTALCVLVAAVSLGMIVKTVTRSVRTTFDNRALSERRAQLERQTEETTQPALAETDAPPDETAAPQQAAAPAEEPTAAQETAAPQAPEAEEAGQSPTAGTGVSAAKADTVKSTQYHRASGTALPAMEALYNENHDLIGWLEIPEILDLPVMYRDNSYYLTHDFSGQKTASGAIFLDKSHRFTEYAQNLLLHGHNMKDGTMFGRLVHYAQDISYFKRNAFVNFDTLWEEERYVIFAVLRVSLDVDDDRFFNYFSYPTFVSDTAFESYVRSLQLRSMYAVPIDVQPQDALLTLSTCLDEDRLVIVCRRIREGEKESELQRLVQLATRQ